MVAFIIVMSILAYLFIGGVVGGLIMKYNTKNLDWDDPYPTLGAIFWPLIVPFMIVKLTAEAVYNGRSLNPRKNHDA